MKYISYGVLLKLSVQRIVKPYQSYLHKGEGAHLQAFAKQVSWTRGATGLGFSGFQSACCCSLYEIFQVISMFFGLRLTLL